MLYGDEIVMQVLYGFVKLVLLKLEELDNEFLFLDLNVVVVENMDGVIVYICEYGIQYFDVILMSDMYNVVCFVNEVDFVVVYVNVFICFIDGGQFGFGVEVVVSMQKLYVCGLMGFEVFIIYKWIGFGDGMICV